MGGGVNRGQHGKRKCGFPYCHVPSWVPPGWGVHRGGGWKGVYQWQSDGLRSLLTGSPQHVWAIR